MILGIDASNVRAGGGVTHLVELLRAANPRVHEFNQVIVWGGAATLNKIEERDWLRKEHDPLLDHELVEWSMKLPLRWKLRGGVNKYLLRKLAYRYLPRAVLDRPKQGFAPPIWLRLQSYRDKHAARVLDGAIPA